MLGWIFGGLVKNFERAARDVSQDFIKSSGREIDRLFNEKLAPLADKLDYIVEKRIKESKSEIEELEVRFKTDIEGKNRDVFARWRGDNTWYDNIQLK
ncbi:MAG: hypothetical protein U7127_01335 [Phormidium sp.]